MNVIRNFLFYNDSSSQCPRAVVSAFTRFRDTRFTRDGTSHGHSAYARHPATILSRSKAYFYFGETSEKSRNRQRGFKKVRSPNRYRNPSRFRRRRRRPALSTPLLPRAIYIFKLFLRDPTSSRQRAFSAPVEFRNMHTSGQELQLHPNRLCQLFVQLEKK